MGLLQNIIHAVEGAVGGAPHAALQVQQAQHSQLGNNSALAQLYAKNPTDPRVAHMDPAQFGYPADNSGQQLRVNHSTNYGAVPTSLLVGLSNLQRLQQGGAFNPGFTPLQGTLHTALPQPNLLAPHVPQGINYNPQNVRPLY